MLPLASFRPDELTHPTTATLSFVRAALVSALSLAFAYGINSIHDRATDRSVEKNPLAGSPIVAIETRALVWGAGVLALGVALTGGVRTSACAFVSLAVGAAYSAGPRLKGYPFLGTLMNVGIFLPLMWMAAPTGPRSSVLPLTFTALLLQNQLLHEREDAEEDRAAGVTTTAAVLGARGTVIATLVIGTAGVLALFLSGAATREVAIACAACALASFAPLVRARRTPRAVHRAVAFICGVMVYAATWMS
jgi:4-hydroxybenzoate polyprenyltransferase